MEKYLRYQFYEHPSISAVLARHWANNYVKPDDAQGSKIKALKTALKTLQIKVDFLRTAQDTSQPSSYSAKIPVHGFRIGVARDYGTSSRYLYSVYSHIRWLAELASCAGCSQSSVRQVLS